MKATKKPVTIEFFPVSEAIAAASKDWKSLPRWLADAYEVGNVLFLPQQVNIVTREGTMVGNMDDLIIQGVNGELYPCKPDIFAKTYDIQYEG
jgi:hypothetical protein